MLGVGRFARASCIATEITISEDVLAVGGAVDRAGTFFRTAAGCLLNCSRAASALFLLLALAYSRGV